ncbi:hypothetical protein I090019C5_11060 [Phocaeicola massiliensis]|jgi:natural product precursor|uniref:TIGR04149 family rSAM-modified RiPP n=1 Tax=Phocaeicola massiliensis TaxID=204516 RepID=UPI0034BDE3E3
MKTLKKIKLNGLNDAELRDREMDALNGGNRACGCGCNYEGSGGSTTDNNGNANFNLGPSGGTSIGGCKSSGEPTVVGAIVVGPS